jgi:exonuclease III
MRNWTILNWNVRGLNSDNKCNVIRAKIEESACAVFCLQETKRCQFDNSTVKKMAPKRFNKFEFVPAEGASGGIFVGWNGSFFKGETIFKSKFAITINFASTHNADQWKLTSVYGPCHG